MKAFLAAAKLMLVVAPLAGVVVVTSVWGSHNASQHENMRLIANYDDGGTYRNGTDIAFWGNRAILGRLDQATGGAVPPAGPGGFRIMDISDPANPKEVGEFTCPGDQSDVSIWGDIVIVSVDKPTVPDCRTPATGESSRWEGIRIVSIADPAKPVVLKEIKTDCGSHTNTLYPDLANQRLLVYVLSYPLAGRYNPPAAMADGCTQGTHSKISIISVPLADPAGAGLFKHQPRVEPTIGCHDVTVFMERQLAAAACLTESQIWDLSNEPGVENDGPAHPRIIGRIRDPRINIHHSTVFSNDGRTVVVGDELGGAAASPGCFSDRDAFGGLFFYDVTGNKTRDPESVGTYKIPQREVSEFCTAHLFNTVPRRDEKDVLVSSWYTGATSVIDFTDPSKPRQIAYYIPEETTSPDQQEIEAAAWASYWYNGYVYSNNFDEDVNSVVRRSRGFDVFTVNHPLVEEGALRLGRLNPQLQEALPGGGGGGGLRKGPCANKKRGQRGADHIKGSHRGDLIGAGRGNDVVLGGRGIDCLFGQAGRDRLAGGKAGDKLGGGVGRDRLRGRRGPDRLQGGDGADVLIAGAGADRVIAAGDIRDIVRCGKGRDRAVVDARDIVRGCERVRRR